MKTALIHHGEKSDKFWWIHYQGDDFVVNFGKVNTFGRFQIKEFDNAEECEKQAKKLIASKIKKGYKEDVNFDFNRLYYFDDEEYGLHQKTSHPNFLQYCQSEFYFDCSDEEAPFGSDEGDDTLSGVEEEIRKYKQINWSGFAQKQIEVYWGMEYIPPTEKISAENLSAKLAEKADNEMNIYQTDHVIVAVAFAQLKITGTIEKDLRNLALLALHRIDILAKIKDWGENSTIHQQMITDLKKVDYE